MSNNKKCQCELLRKNYWGQVASFEIVFKGVSTLRLPEHG